MGWACRMSYGKKGFGDVEWIHMARDKDRWRVLVNTVLNIGVA
jgi:hypothetical protein